MEQAARESIKSLVGQPTGVTEADVKDDGMVIQVPNKVIARLLQLGLHADRAQRRRAARRRQQKNSRRRNR